MAPGCDRIEQEAEERRRRHPVVTRGTRVGLHRVVEIRSRAL
jgi:hypothetical protein